MKKSAAVLCVILSISFFFFSACAKHADDTICSLTDPTQDLQRLKDRIAGMETETGALARYFYVAQGTFKVRAVFVFDNCCPNSNTIVTVYDCQGQHIGEMGDEISDRAAIQNSKIIFKRNDSPCLSTLGA